MPDSIRHEAAIEQAYLLVEVAQGHNDAARVDRADREATANGWDDVRLLLHFARSLASHDAGDDDSGHVQAMFDAAARLTEPSLLALSIATKAVRNADRRRTTITGESAGSLFVGAVVLLDDPDPAVLPPHRAAALIEVGNVAHQLGFWELALEYFTLAEQTSTGALGGRWSDIARRQLVVTTINRCELLLDWACALAGIGEWDQAASLAASAPARADPTDSRWPPSWVAQYHGQMHLLAALAGSEPHRTAPANVAALGEAIEAARAGDDVRACRLAEAATQFVEVSLPSCTHLLALSLAARRPGTAPAAIRYGQQLASLRWNDRVDRMAGIRDAIAVERHRRDHEQLRRDLVLDELTGLANRRGYHAYLTALDDPSGPAAHHSTEYAVLMIDVDHFKAVNDGFGHDIGDLVLARLGHIFAAHVRQTDLAARLGGDEFLIILADVLPEVPEIRAEKILRAVQTYPWPEVAEGLAVSISIGVQHGSRHELPTLLSDADRNLYHAKNHGRGRVAAPA
ncbi:GGDEF domain-containing protein [Paractinoplanes durhamensis]|uniref:GGDEF domain-containing protein n=1 Tax=Paractinoplanes durhamensis TaxID=113563 RepID=UPI0031DF3180